MRGSSQIELAIQPGKTKARNVLQLSHLETDDSRQRAKNSKNMSVS
jgi:hypothetical protein